MISTQEKSKVLEMFLINASLEGLVEILMCSESNKSYFRKTIYDFLHSESEASGRKRLVSRILAIKAKREGIKSGK